VLAEGITERSVVLAEGITERSVVLAEGITERSVVLAEGITERSIAIRRGALVKRSVRESRVIRRVVPQGMDCIGAANIAPLRYRSTLRPTEAVFSFASEA
jgi:hypothetical protein